MTEAHGSRAVLPIGLLAAAGFLSSAGARVIDSLLHVVATDFGVSVPLVSVIVAAFTLPYGLNQIILGPVGDRYGKLKVMLGALIGYALATAGCALAANLPQLTVLRAAAGASSAGLIPVCLAYIGDAVPYEERQVTLSRFLTGVVLAQILAGPVGGVFGEYVGWRGVFVLLSAAAAVVAVILAVNLRGLPDRRRQGSLFRVSDYIRLATDVSACSLLVATLIEGALLAGTFPFVAPFLHEEFGLGYAEVGLILSCFGLGAYGYTRYAKRIVPRLGEPGMVLVGGGLIVGGLAVGMSVPAWWIFIPVEALLGLGYFTLHAVLQARSTEMLPDARATAVASFVFVLFLGQSLGALLMGLEIEQVGYRVAFWINAAAVALLSVGIGAMVRRPAR